jgi:hypothetical protein
LFAPNQNANLDAEPQEQQLSRLFILVLLTNNKFGGKVMITYKGFKIYADNSHYYNGWHESQHAARTEKVYNGRKFICFHDCFARAIEFVRAITN